jgi:hypothetical protein
VTSESQYADSESEYAEYEEYYPDEDYYEAQAEHEYSDARDDVEDACPDASEEELERATELLLAAGYDIEADYSYDPGENTYSGGERYIWKLSPPAAVRTVRRVTSRRTILPRPVARRNLPVTRPRARRGRRAAARSPGRSTGDTEPDPAPAGGRPLELPLRQGAL